MEARRSLKKRSAARVDCDFLTPKIWTIAIRPIFVRADFLTCRFSYVLRGRQRQGKGRSFAELALHTYMAGHLFGDMFDDRQAQAGAPGFPRACLIDAVKTLEDARQLVRRNPDPRVLH